MPLIFKGNINGSVSSVSQNLPMEIVSLILTNQTGGAVAVNVKIGNVHVIPKDKSIAANDEYRSDVPILIGGEDVIEVSTNGSLDYYFSLFNVNP